jgi:hypothetical protein
LADREIQGATVPKMAARRDAALQLILIAQQFGLIAGG